MKIIKIKLNGFKNIYDTEIEFRNITALLSLNNYGKSNLIEGIKFALAFIKFPNVSKTKFMRGKPFIPINKFNASNNFLFEIELISKMNNKDYFINYDFSFEWIKTNIGGEKIVSENLKIKKSESDKYSAIIKRDNSEIGYYKTAETGRVDKEIKPEENELIINKLIHFDDLYYLEIIKDLNNINFDPLTFYDPDDLYNFFPFELIESEKIKIDKYSRNIPKIIKNLEREHKEKYNILVNTLKALFPNIKEIFPFSQEIKVEKKEIHGNIPFKISDKIYAIFVNDEYLNQQIDFKYLSTGTKRLFLFLTEVILADLDKIPLISFEELENCLHPSLFQDMLQILTEIAPNCRILITSHSPYLVKYLDFEDIYVGVPFKEGYAQFKKVKKIKQKSLLKLAEQQGISIGDYIFEILSHSNENSEVIKEIF